MTFLSAKQHELGARFRRVSRRLFRTIANIAESYMRHTDRENGERGKETGSDRTPDNPFELPKR